jgi:1,4-alpha-glucan branching enzyme
MDGRVHRRGHPAQTKPRIETSAVLRRPAREGAEMIERRQLDEGHVEVTFRLPADHPAEPVGVAGDFNDWALHPLRDTGGKLEATVVVAGGRVYQFRYRTADGRWFNDEEADDYVENEFGGVNCLLDLTT